MKRTRTLALLTALVCLCVSLTACSPKEVLKSAILKTTTALGLRQETSDEDEVDDLSYATSGGDVPFPERWTPLPPSWCPRWTATPCM